MLVFCHSSIAPRVSILSESTVAERVWLLLHTNDGPVAVAAWYRPPGQTECPSISSLVREWEAVRDMTIGTIVIGDLNVHSCRWLRFSSGESAAGGQLRRTSSRLGLKQIVKEPTRGDNLLDLVLTYLGSAMTQVVLGISYHKMM